MWPLSVAELLENPQMVIPVQRSRLPTRIEGDKVVQKRLAAH